MQRKMSLARRICGAESRLRDSDLCVRQSKIISLGIERAGKL